MEVLRQPRLVLMLIIGPFLILLAFGLGYDATRPPLEAIVVMPPDSALQGQDEDLSEVPIMAVTAYSAQGDEERIRAAGAQAYVSKPISVVRFAETVEDLLAGKAQEIAPAGTP